MNIYINQDFAFTFLLNFILILRQYQIISRVNTLFSWLYTTTSPKLDCFPTIFFNVYLGCEIIIAPVKITIEDKDNPKVTNDIFFIHNFTSYKPILLFNNVL